MLEPQIRRSPCNCAYINHPKPQMSGAQHRPMALLSTSRTRAVTITWKCDLASKDITWASRAVRAVIRKDKTGRFVHTSRTESGGLLYWPCSLRASMVHYTLTAPICKDLHGRPSKSLSSDPFTPTASSETLFDAHDRPELVTGRSRVPLTASPGSLGGQLRAMSVKTGPDRHGTARGCQGNQPCLPLNGSACTGIYTVPSIHSVAFATYNKPPQTRHLHQRRTLHPAPRSQITQPTCRDGRRQLRRF